MRGWEWVSKKGEVGQRRGGTGYIRGWAGQRNQDEMESEGIKCMLALPAPQGAAPSLSASPPPARRTSAPDHAADGG